MSDVIVADVRVRERAGRRVTTIRVVEGRDVTERRTRATSVPPVVRDELTAWLATANPAPQDGFEDGGLHVGAGAVVQAADDPPKTVTARTPGFVPPAPVVGD